MALSADAANTDSVITDDVLDLIQIVVDTDSAVVADSGSRLQNMLMNTLFLMIVLFFASDVTDAVVAAASADAGAGGYW